MSSWVVLLVAVLGVLSVIAGFVALHLKDLLSAVVLMGTVDLLLALLFYVLEAPDVAITQATVGAGLSVAVFLYALRRTERYER